MRKRHGLNVRQEALKHSAVSRGNSYLFVVNKEADRR